MILHAATLFAANMPDISPNFKGLPVSGAANQLLSWTLQGVLYAALFAVLFGAGKILLGSRSGSSGMSADGWGVVKIAGPIVILAIAAPTLVNAFIKIGEMIG